jgi:hypothetical protein
MARERLRQPSLPEVLSEVLAVAICFEGARLARRAYLEYSREARGGLLGLAGVFGLWPRVLLGALVAWITTFDELHSAFLWWPRVVLLAICLFCRSE